MRRSPISFKRRVQILVKQKLFWGVTLWGHSWLLAGALIFHFSEVGLNPKVHDFLDSLSWAVGTITTVGSGDLMPITAAGKILNILMMISGSLFLWTYTALIISAIVSPDLQVVEDEVQGLERDLLSVEKKTSLDQERLKELLLRIEDLSNHLRGGNPPKNKIEN